MSLFDSFFSTLSDIGGSVSGLAGKVLPSLGDLSGILSMANIGMGTAGAFMDYSAKKKYAKQTLDAIQQNLMAGEEALSEQKSQFDSKTLQEMGDRAKQATIQRAKVRAAVGDAGLAGNTVERLQQEVDAMSGMDVAMLGENRDRYGRQVDREKRSLQAKAQTQKSQVRQPSVFGDLVGPLGKLYMGSAGAPKAKPSPLTKNPNPFDFWTSGYGDKY